MCFSTWQLWGAWETFRPKVVSFSQWNFFRSGVYIWCRNFRMCNLLVKDVKFLYGCDVPTVAVLCQVQEVSCLFFGHVMLNSIYFSVGSGLINVWCHRTPKVLMPKRITSPKLVVFLLRVHGHVTISTKVLAYWLLYPHPSVASL